MQIIVKGRNLEVSPSLKNYAEGKIKKLNRYFDTIKEVQIEFSLEKTTNLNKNQRVEVIIKVPKKTIRGEESSSDMYTSVDEVVEKLERQIKKYKEKLRKHMDKSSLRKSSQEKLIKITESKILTQPSPIVKIKNFLMKPMDTEEAIQQMELLGHSFFIFLNSETEGINVIYKRKDGNYGLIQPEF